MELKNVLEHISDLIDNEFDVKTYIGSLEAEESIALQIVAQGADTTFYTKKELRTIGVTLLVKRFKQVDAMNLGQAIGDFLSRKKEYTNTDEWQLFNIEHDGSIFVEKEKSSGMYIYATDLNLEIYY